MPDQGLTESDVRRWIGEASFGHGRRYFQRGHILNPRRQGETLKARCLGSRPQPYHVEVTLGQGGQLFIRVAQAAEQSRPRAAIRIHMGTAERLVAAKHHKSQCAPHSSTRHDCRSRPATKCAA